MKTNVGIVLMEIYTTTVTFKKILLYAFGSFLLMVLIVSFFIGRAQPISFYRFTSFTYAAMLCFCLILFSIVLENRRFSILFVSLLLFSILFSTNRNYLEAITSKNAHLVDEHA